MAKIIREPTFDPKPSCVHQSSLEEHYEDDQMLLNSASWSASYNVVDYIKNREYGMHRYRSIPKVHYTKHILKHKLLKEYPIALRSMDKILCSQWINSKQIVFGTKCNKLMMYNIHPRGLQHIPSVRGHFSNGVNKRKGIHSLKINPSRSLLATVGANSNEIAVYKLPTFDPFNSAERVHRKRIRAVEWVDNEFFVSGSQDSTLALWHVRNELEGRFYDDDIDNNNIKLVRKYVNPLLVGSCRLEKDIRAIVFDKHSKNIISLSTFGFIHIWNVEHFTQTYSKQLSTGIENVCMAINDECGLYAVGRISSTLVVDPRTMNSIQCIPIHFHGRGIKCLSFEGSLMTIGTDVGVVMFYDIRQRKYLEPSLDSSTSVGYKIKGDPLDDDNQPYKCKNFIPAINTHCYDYSRTRLFTGGGPVKDSIFGCYASLWR